MCFSAEASFATGAVLIPVGIYCVKRAWDEDRAYVALAVTPLVFALQQVCEGLVWLGLGRDDAGLTRSAALAFLFFALVFWPAWIPFAGRSLASSLARKRVLAAAAPVAFVAGLAAYLPLVLTSRDCLNVAIAQHSIRYEFESLLAFEWVPRGFWQVAYVVVVAAPLMVAPQRRVRVFGVLVAISSILAHVVFARTFISVWCMFAGILSAWLCVVFRALEPHVDEGRPVEVAVEPV